MRGTPFIVSAPSGAGKTTLCNKAVEHFQGLKFSVSYTTRAPRGGERDGVEYHFISGETFQEMVDGGEFLEYATVHGNRYGTSRAEVERVLESGDDIIFDVDVQGAAQLRKVLSGGIYIFIVPPSAEACRERLKGRGEDSEEVIEGRVKRSTGEISRASDYDYVIINDVLVDAFDILRSVVVSRRARSEAQVEVLKEIFSDVFDD